MGGPFFAFPLHHIAYCSEFCLLLIAIALEWLVHTHTIGRGFRTIWAGVFYVFFLFLFAQAAQKVAGFL